MADRYLLVSEETAGAYRVGISPEDFFENFMPWSDKTSDIYKNAQPNSSSLELLKSMAKAKNEAKMYAPYRKALNDWTGKCIECDPEQSHVINTAFGKRRDPDAYTGPALVAVDVGHYEVLELPPGDKSDHSLMQTQVEFKYSANKDPFIDPGPKSPTSKQKYPFENPNVEATRTRGQIASYAAVTLHLSFRIHLFTVGIFGKYCRFIRWDRRGAVVTRRFDYTEEPETIFHFYHRFAQLARTERGFDPTVTKIDQSSEEATNAKHCFSRYSKDMQHCDGRADVESDPQMELNPLLLKMTVVFDGVERSFIVPSPRFYFGCFSPFSRSTRRSLAYNPTAKKKGTPELLFMKDYWREDSDRTAPEAEIYKLLEQKGVKEHIAVMDIGGDVPQLRTLWQETTFGSFCLFPDPENSNYNALHGHRIFLKTIAMDLTVFLNARWLVTCVADGMQAAQEAFSKARVLHRDISIGNIMIVLKDNNEREGILIDWDHCIVLQEAQSPSRMLRTGTWHFMSARLLQGINRDHSTLDDQESAYWVLLYVALRYLKNNISANGLFHTLRQLFDVYIVDDDGRVFGGAAKLKHLNDAARFSGIHFEIPQLVDMFNELADGLSAPYLPAPSKEEIALYELISQNMPPESVARISAAGRYYAARKSSSNMEWFIKTLRTHAARIPLPSSQTPSPNNAQQARTPYDYHHNRIIEDRLRGKGDSVMKHHQSRISSARLDGLAGRLIPAPSPRTSLKRSINDESENDDERKRMKNTPALERDN